MLVQKIRSLVSPRRLPQLCPAMEPGRRIMRPAKLRQRIQRPAQLDEPAAPRKLLPWADPYIADLHRRHEDHLRRESAAADCRPDGQRGDFSFRPSRRARSPAR